MKTSVSSYSYHKLLKSGEMDLFQVMDKTKELGFDAIEFIEFEAPEGKTLSEFAAELRAYAEKLGLAISNRLLRGKRKGCHINRHEGVYDALQSPRQSI